MEHQSASPGKALRLAITDACLQVPGAPNALAARLIERMGFEAMYLSAAAVSASDLALSDCGLLSLSELAEQTRRLVRAAPVPLIVDAASGFGGVPHVQRTIRELESAGAAAIQIDDRASAHRHGRSSTAVIAKGAMRAKLQAAVAARRDRHLIIIARTDAREGEGYSAAVERAHAYLGAGADWIVPGGLQAADEFDQFAELVSAPLVADMSEFGPSPMLSLEELGEMGYSGVLYPLTLLRVATRAMEAALALLGSEGIQTELAEVMQTQDELDDLLGVGELGEGEPPREPDA